MQSNACVRDVFTDVFTEGICRFVCGIRRIQKYFLVPLLKDLRKIAFFPHEHILNTSWTHRSHRSSGAWTHFWTHQLWFKNVGFFHQFLTICQKLAIRDQYAPCIIQYASLDSLTILKKSIFLNFLTNFLSKLSKSKISMTDSKN